MSFPALADGKDAEFLFCRFPDVRHASGFQPSSWIFDGDSLRQAGAQYAAYKVADDEIDPRLSLKIISRTPDELQMQWSNTPRKTPRFIVNLKTGQSSRPAFAKPNMEFGTCVIKKHALDGSEIVH
jgi:hypothetical protein